MTALGAYRRLVRLTAGDTNDATSTAEVNAALTLVSVVRADLDRCELALLEAARAGAASWTDIAAALSLGSKQAAQQRYRRLAAAATATHPAAAVNAALTARPSGSRQPEPSTRGPAPDEHGPDDQRIDDHAHEDGREGQARRGGRDEDDRYDLVRAEHYAQTGRWLVTVDGRPIGAVAPEHRGRTKRWSAWHGSVRVTHQTYRSRTDAAVQVLMAHGEHTRRRRTSTKR